MTYQIIDIKCPGCGEPVNTSQKVCAYCGRQVVISTFNSVYKMPIPQVNKYANTYMKALNENPDNQELNTSIAMCYLKLNLYEKALPFFEKAIENNFENSELFFYAAVCLLRGQKAFNTPMSDVKSATKYVMAAIMMEPRGVYYYFLAYVKYDFYERKCLNIFPDYSTELQNSKNNNVTYADIDMLFDILGKPIPEQIKL